MKKLRLKRGVAWFVYGFVAFALCLGIAQAEEEGAAAEPSEAKEAPALSVIGEALRGKLLKLTDPYAIEDGTLKKADERKLEPFVLSEGDEPAYYAIYFSAKWCPPCRRFTPELVKFYKANREGRPNFEVVFVSSDRGPEAMADYMKSYDMPWPVLKFSEKNRTEAVTRYAGSGIPCLVVVDGKGKVISDSFVNGDYVGPYKVLEELDDLLEGE